MTVWICGWLWVAFDLLALIYLVRAPATGLRNVTIALLWVSGAIVLFALNAL